MRDVPEGFTKAPRRRHENLRRAVVPVVVLHDHGLRLGPVLAIHDARARADERVVELALLRAPREPAIVYHGQELMERAQDAVAIVPVRLQGRANFGWEGTAAGHDCGGRGVASAASAASAAPAASRGGRIRRSLGRRWHHRVHGQRLAASPSRIAQVRAVVGERGADVVAAAYLENGRFHLLILAVVEPYLSGRRRVLGGLRTGHAQLPSMRCLCREWPSCQFLAT